MVTIGHNFWHMLSHSSYSLMHLWCRGQKHRYVIKETNVLDIVRSCHQLNYSQNVWSNDTGAVVWFVAMVVLSEQSWVSVTIYKDYNNTANCDPYQPASQMITVPTILILTLVKLWLSSYRTNYYKTEIVCTVLFLLLKTIRQWQCPLGRVLRLAGGFYSV